MIIKTIENQQEAALQAQPVRYEVYDTVPMQTPDSKTVQVLQLREKISVEEANQRISSYNNQITSMTAEKAKYEAILVEIEKL